ILISGEIVADVESWNKLRDRAMTLIDNAHAKNSERAGLELNELRIGLGDQTPNVFEALVSDLCAKGFARKKHVIARSSHRAKLPPHLTATAAKIVSVLS